VIALLQRVTQASVAIDQKVVAKIDGGLLVLIGIQASDDESRVKKLTDKMLAFRMFSDEDGKMNLDIRQAQGELLLVPQFTLAADTSRGRRPGFSFAAPPWLGLKLFTAFCDRVETQYPHVQKGVFGAEMQVALINNGPATFWLEV
jgi:D-tyrosyl-tRNA(Tyr) deacylase